MIGEKLTKPGRLRNNRDYFTRDETRKTDQVLRPERCESPAVEETVVEPNVFAFCLGCYLYYLEGLEGDVIRLSEGHHIGDEYSGT